MKKVIISGVVLSLSGVMLASCGGTKETSSKSATKDLKLTQVSFPLKEKVSLKMTAGMSTLAPKNPNDMLLFKRLEEQSNVHIEWTNYASDFAEKRNLDIASGDLPDAFFNAQAGDEDLLTWGKNGVIVPLEDIIDKYMPNLQQVFKERPQYKEMLTASDGHIYSFPWIEELGEGKKSIHTVNSLAWINKKWLDNLGLAMPETTEELHTVLKAFKENDPNGNGKKDEIPMSFISKDDGNDLKMLTAAFGDGTGDNGDHLTVSNDHKVIFTANQSGYKDSIKYFHSLYKEGLIDKEAFEQDWNRYVGKGNDQKYGLFFTWDKNNLSAGNDDYVLLPVLTGDNGQKNVTRTNNMGFSRDRFVITSGNKNIELTAKWVDQLYAPTQSVQDNWGTYGDKKQQNIFEYDQAANQLKHLDLDGAAPVEIREKTAIAGPLAILDSYYGKYTTMPDDAKWRLDLMEKDIFPYVKNENNYPRLFLNLEDTKKIADIDADMQDYISRKRDEWITKGTVDKEWQDYLVQLEKLGLKEWMSIKQNNYDAYVEKGEK